MAIDKTKLIIGAIGHTDHDRVGNTIVVVALMNALINTGKETIVDSDTVYITAPKLKPFDNFKSRNFERKSKGEKRRERSERRRKWGI